MLLKQIKDKGVCCLARTNGDNSGDNSDNKNHTVDLGFNGWFIKTGCFLKDKEVECIIGKPHILLKDSTAFYKNVEVIMSTIEAEKCSYISEEMGC